MTTAREWLEEIRGLDLEQLVRYGVKFGKGRAGEVVAFPYRRHGETYNHKVRKVGERADLDVPFYWERSGVPHGLFNEDALHDETMQAQPVIITEGEMDALSVIECGFPRTVSLADGWSGDANADNLKAKPLFDMRPLFVKSPCIVIAGDNDRVGEQFVRAAFNIFDGHPVKYVVWPDGCKDANETLAKHGQGAVARSINGARPVNPPGGRVSTLRDRNPDPSGAIYTTGDQVADGALCFHEGFMTVSTGIPASGKTTFWTWALHMAGMKHGIRVGSCFRETPNSVLEDQLCRLNTGRPVAHLTRQERDAFLESMEPRWRLLEDEKDACLDMGWMRQMMWSAAVQHGCKIVAFDPWNEFEHSPLPGESMTDYTKNALTKMRQWAERFGCALLIIAHPTKMQGEAGAKPRAPLGYDISGSSTWFDKAAIGVTIHRDTDDRGDHTQVINWKTKFEQMYPCRRTLKRMDYDPDLMCFRRRMC